MAESCGSTAWVVALTNVCNWMASVLPDQAQQDIFGDNHEVAGAYAITKIRGAIDALLSAHGASSFADVSPLQRIWRDANTAGRHAVADPLVNQEVYGKALMGIPYEDNVTPVI